MCETIRSGTGSRAKRSCSVKSGLHQMLPACKDELVAGILVYTGIDTEAVKLMFGENKHSHANQS